MLSNTATLSIQLLWLGTLTPGVTRMDHHQQRNEKVTIIYLSHVHVHLNSSLPSIRPPPTHTHTPSHTHTHTPSHTHIGAQPVTRRVCPNCEESCHIRCKKCPECEHEFPPSTKSRAKPDQKNPSSLRRSYRKRSLHSTHFTLY